MRVLITQPAPEAAVSARALSARGHEPISIPLVTVERETSPQINLTSAQAFLATSAEGIRALAEHVGVRTFPVFVDSDLTAAEARAAGFKDVSAAKDDSQDLARLVERRLKPGNGALIYACSTSAPVNLSAMLGNMGFAVRALPLYSVKRVADLPGELREKLTSSSIDAALFMSPDEARAFVTLIQRDETVPPVAGLKTVAATPAIAAPLRALKGASVTVAAASDPDTVWATLDGDLIDKVEAERKERDRKAKEAEERRRAEEQRIRGEQEERARREKEQAEVERVERERVEAERTAAARIAAERAEQERLARDEEQRARAAEARQKREQLERERIEKQTRENEERVRQAEEKAARETAARELREKERAERDRLKAEEAARAKAEKERLAAERSARDAAERERVRAEREERDRLKAEENTRLRLEKERLAAEQKEEARLRKEKEERERAERAEAELLRREQDARERAEKERLAAEEKARAKAERERRALEEAARNEAERQRLASERTAWEEAERVRRAAEKAERDRLEAERLARETAERGAREKARAEKERAAREESARVHAENERLAREREKEREERERTAREESARVHAENERLAREREKEREERERAAHAEAERRRAEKERQEREQAEAERIDRDRRAEAARLEKERRAQEKAEQAKVKAAQAREEAERKRIAREETAAQKARAQQERRDEDARRREEKARLAEVEAERRRLEREAAAEAKAERKRKTDEQKAAAGAEQARRRAAQPRAPGWGARLAAWLRGPTSAPSTAESRWTMTISEDESVLPASSAVASAPSSWNDMPMTDQVRQADDLPAAAPEPPSGGSTADAVPPAALVELHELVERESAANRIVDKLAPTDTLADARPAARSGGGRSAQMLVEDAADDRARDRLKNWGLGDSSDTAPVREAEPGLGPEMPASASQPRRGSGRTIALVFTLATIATALTLTSDRWLPILSFDEPAPTAAAPAAPATPKPRSPPPVAVTPPPPAATTMTVDTPPVSPASGNTNQVIASLMARIAALEAALGNTAGLAAIDRRVEILEGRSADANSVLALTDRVTALERGVHSAADARAAAVALTIAATQWREAVVAGRPFLKEWDTVKALSGDAPTDAAFARFAATGLPTLPELQRRFDVAAAAAVRASYLPNDASSWLRRVLDRAMSVVTVRRIDVDVGDGLEAILVRAERAVDASDLRGAVAELRKLTGAPSTVAAEWIVLADARSAAEEAAQQSIIDGATALAAPTIRAAPAAPPGPVVK